MGCVRFWRHTGGQPPDPRSIFAKMKWLSSQGLHCKKNPVWQGGGTRNRSASGMANGVQDGGGGRDQDMFAQTLGTERAFGVRHLDQDAVNLRHITGQASQRIFSGASVMAWPLRQGMTGGQPPDHRDI